MSSILYYLDDSITCSMTSFSKTRSIVRASWNFIAIKIIIFFISHFGLNSYLILLCFLQVIFFLNKVHFFMNFQTSNDHIKLALSLVVFSSVILKACSWRNCFTFIGLVILSFSNLKYFVLKTIKYVSNYC